MGKQDTILLGPDKDEIVLLVKRLSRSFRIEDQGDLSDYLGIKIERKPDGTLEWSQPTLIQSILKDLKLDGEDIKGRQNKPNIKPIPAHTSVPLTDHRDSPDHNPKDFEYRQVIGKFGNVNKTRHFMCCTPMCQTLCQSKDTTYSSSQEDRQVSARYKG